MDCSILTATVFSITHRQRWCHSNREQNRRIDPYAEPDQLFGGQKDYRFKRCSQGWLEQQTTPVEVLENLDRDGDIDILVINWMAQNSLSISAKLQETLFRLN